MIWLGLVVCSQIGLGTHAGQFRLAVQRLIARMGLTFRPVKNAHVAIDYLLPLQVGLASLDSLVDLLRRWDAVVAGYIVIAH